MSLDKLPLVDERTIEVHPNGPLTGHTIVLRYPPSALFRKWLGEGLTNAEMFEAVFVHEVDSTIEGGIGAAPQDAVMGLFDEWILAFQEAALSKANGRRSVSTSSTSPKTRRRGTRSLSSSPSSDSPSDTA